MKKIFKTLLMLLPLSLVIGCSPVKGEANNNGAAGDVPTLPDQEITTYLVLSRNGLYEGKKGQNFPDLFLENTIAFTGKTGDALPGKDKITSSVEGVEFLNWISYENDGKPTIHNQVGKTNNKILYAFFHSTIEGGGEIPDPKPNPDPNPDTPTIKDGTYIIGLNEGTTLNTKLVPNPGNSAEVMATGITLTKDDKFEIVTYKDDVKVSNIQPKSDLLNNDNFKACITYKDNVYTVIADCSADFYIGSLAWINVTPKPVEGTTYHVRVGENDIILKQNPANETEFMTTGVALNVDDTFTIEKVSSNGTVTYIGPKADLLNNDNFKACISFKDNAFTVIKACTADFYVSNEAWISVNFNN